MSTLSEDERATPAAEEDRQVVEFELDSERYCVAIEYVEQIVERGSLTPVPGTPSHVRGVMDLRGETTRILDPRRLLDVGDSEDSTSRVLVFAATECDLDEQVGWLVDDVTRVRRVRADETDASGVLDRDGIVGVINGDGDSDGDDPDGFTIWVDPLAFV